MKTALIFKIVLGLALLVPMAIVLAAMPSEAASNDILVPSGPPLLVDVHKGSVVKLSKPAASVFIADPKVADIKVMSPTLVSVIGSEPGDTTLYAIDEYDRVIYSSVVTVTRNLSQLRGLIKGIAPDADVEVTAVEGALMLSGTVESAATADQIVTMAKRFLSSRKDDQRTSANDDVINHLRIAGSMQVNLQVRITEASRDINKQLGFNWESSFFDGTTLFGILNGRDVFDVVTNPITGLPARSFRTVPDTAGHYFFDRQFGNLNMTGTIDALEKNGLLTVLAEPNLTALSGETASFLAGGEFPVPVVQASTGTSNNVTIEYKKFGVSLSFTPTVLANDHINLRVEPEVSQLTSNGAVQFSGFQVPALSTRRANTTVELGSGQSFAIAGLLQNNLSQDVNKLPGLGNLPIIGALFQSTKFQRNESELVIIVTPYLVKPTSPKNLMAPVDGFKAPNDAQRMLLGETEHAYQPKMAPAQSGSGTRRLVGGGGFMAN